jgi:hypothetical protein
MPKSEVTLSDENRAENKNALGEKWKILYVSNNIAKGFLGLFQ